MSEEIEGESTQDWAARDWAEVEAALAGAGFVGVHAHDPDLGTGYYDRALVSLTRDGVTRFYALL